MGPDFLEAMRRLGLEEMADIFRQFDLDLLQAGYMLEPTLTLKSGSVNIGLKIKQVSTQELPLLDGVTTGNGHGVSARVEMYDTVGAEATAAR